MRRSMILVFGNRSRHQENGKSGATISLATNRQYYYEILDISLGNVRFKLTYHLIRRSSNFNDSSEELARNWQT